MQTDGKRSEEMMKVFGILIEDAPRAAEMLYMATMVTALKVNKGDAEEIADKLGIDEKALFMANYEYELTVNGHLLSEP
ncbi:hypothetical protein [Butyrivibrio sp. AE2005]|uniref:hypothetical protein n=1 Tax=Butyrivibrio sp. AE2005 TaxID=1496722 RepID=UPI00047A1572|nr:hypothetical protein [Butyrivibrio sp. AE2005]